MSSRRKYMLGTFALGCLGVSPAFAQFGNLLGGGGKSAGDGGDVTAKVADFMSRSAVLSVLAANSLAKINAAFASEEEIARRKAEQQELSKITDPKEQSARAAKIYESERAAAETLAKSGDLGDRMKKLDGEKKKLVGNALFNFMIGALQAPALAKSGQEVVQSAGANPMNLPKILPVKDSLPLLSKVVEDGSGTIATFIKVAKGADISVPQADVTSKPVSDTII